MAPIDLHDVGGLLLALSAGFHQPQDPAHSPNPAQGTDAKIPSCRLTPELAPVPPAALSDLSADNEVALELALWDSVKDGSPAELESYLEQYPEGTFASLAQTRLDAAASSRPIPATPTPE